MKKNLSRIAKTALLTLIFLILLGGNAGKVFADDTYATYTKLFNNPEPHLPNVHINSNTSTFAKNGWIIDTANQKVIGPRFTFMFSFPKGGEPGDTNAEYTWDHIVAPDSTVHPAFILRSCNLGADVGGIDESSCIYSEIPYKKDAAALTGFWSTFFGYVAAGSGSPQINVTNSITADIGTATNSLVILRKDTAGNYVAGATQDILGSKWFKLATPNTSEVIDWLQRPDQKVSLWYLGDKINGNNGSVAGPADAIDPNNAIDDGTDTIKKWFASNYSYFKIGEASITKPASYAAALTESNNNSVTPNRDIEKSNLPECSMTGGTFGAGSFMGCIARLVYYVVYWPIAWFAGLMGNLFDFFLSYSLSDASYRADFAVKGWQIVRDISNIFFIIILVWTGLSAVFNTSTNMKKVIPNLILNALLINFSLFGTRVIIDISNIVARVFYNTMQVCEGKCIDANNDGIQDNPALGPGKSKALSEKITSAFNPQKIFDQKVLNSAAATKGVDQSYAAQTDSQIAGYFIIVSIIAALILFGIAMMFWKVAFFFLGRVIGLYVAMIFAPFAFLSRGNMPLISNVKELSWDSWLEDLTKYALLAPIFVFFLYIIYSFLETDFITVYLKTISTSFFETIIYIAVPMLIVYFMIKKGVTIAEKYAGDIGKQVQAFAQKAAGFAGGAALGVGALAGGRIIGAAATKLNESSVGSRLRDAAPNSWFARKALKGLNTASAGSYDVRQTAIGKGLFKQMGVDTNSKGLKVVNSTLSAIGVTGLDLSEEARKGGHLADEKRRQENRDKTAKLFEEKMSDEQVKEYNNRKREEYENKIGGIINKDIAKRLQMNVFDVAKMKQTNKIAYDLEVEKSKNDAAVKTKMDKVTPAKELKTPAEVNAARRKDFADTLKKGTVIDQGITSIPLVGGFMGAVTGANVRMRADKKAAKKIEEKNKIALDLEKIQSTIQNGFRDLIALEKHQDSAGFQALNIKEQDDILKYGSIQKGSGPTANEGKHLYDVLDAAEQQDINSKIKELKTTENKKEYERYEKMVEAIEGSRFNMKSINDDLKKLKDDMIAAIKRNDPNKEAIKTAWVEKIEEKMRADTHNKIWADVNKHREEQKKKLKGEEETKPATK